MQSRAIRVALLLREGDRWKVVLWKMQFALGLVVVRGGWQVPVGRVMDDDLGVFHGRGSVDATAGPEGMTRSGAGCGRGRGGPIDQPGG